VFRRYAIYVILLYSSSYGKVRRALAVILGSVVVTAVTMKYITFWDVTLCSLIEIYCLLGLLFESEDAKHYNLPKRL
jgi:hypothetical protein